MGYHTMKTPTAHVEEEALELQKLSSVPTALQNLENDSPVTLIQEGEETPMPKGYDPLDKQVDITYKLPPVPLGNTVGRVVKDVNKAVGANTLMQKLEEAQVEKIEADDHAAFQGLSLGENDSYAATQKLNKQMSNLNDAVISSRITTAENIEAGKLPNGKKIDITKRMVDVPISVP